MLAFAADELKGALEEAVATVLRLAGIKSPPVNAMEVARRLGYEVLWDDGQSGRARIATVRSGPNRRPHPAIFLRRDPRPERVQWATAHEIGEQCAADLCRRLCVEPAENQPDMREQLANLVATRLLLPTVWFNRDSEACDFDILWLKKRFATASHELIARRLLDLSSPVLITIYDHGRLQYRRWNRLGRPPQPTAAERRCRLLAHEAGEPVRQTGPPRIDVWPVHEPDWKREIIRLDLTGDLDEWSDS